MSRAVDMKQINNQNTMLFDYLTSLKAAQFMAKINQPLPPKIEPSQSQARKLNKSNTKPRFLEDIQCVFVHEDGIAFHHLGFVAVVARTAN